MTRTHMSPAQVAAAARREVGQVRRHALEKHAQLVADCPGAKDRRILRRSGHFTSGKNLHWIYVIEATQGHVRVYPLLWYPTTKGTCALQLDAEGPASYFQEHVMERYLQRYLRQGNLLNALREFHLHNYCKTFHPDTYKGDPEAFVATSTAVPLVFGGTAVVSCSPLPVQLLAFDAMLNSAVVDLHWTTGVEVNSSHFEVERSLDMLNWEKLTEIPAQGSSNSPVDYAHSDRPNAFGLLYYRLRMVDSDGAFEHSPIRSVRMSTSHTTCHPNPNQGTFFVLDIAEGSSVQVFDQWGRPAPALTQLDTQGRLRIELLEGASGMYAVRIDNGTNSLVTSVLVSGR